MREREGGITNILGKGAYLNGNIKIEGSIRIDGIVDGEMSISDSLIVGKGGEIKGNIKTKDSVIAGKITGNIYATGKIEFQSGSRIKGDIFCKSLIIEDGVIFDGNCKMSEKEPQKVQPIQPVEKKPEPGLIK